MSINITELQGIYPAIITPMDMNGKIDYPKLDRLIEDQIKAGVSGICGCATTGQGVALDAEEHIEVAAHIKEQINERCQFIVAAGSNNTKSALDMSKKLEEALGPTTFLHVTGYYNNPPQKGIIGHFETLADNLIYSDSNIILYNVPSRTGNNIEAETTIKLAQHSGIIGIKEASGDLKQCRAIIEGTDGSYFRVLTGECDQVASTIEIGGFGAISASCNIAPSLMVNMVKAGLAGDYDTAKALQKKILPVVKAVFRVKNPIPLYMMFNSGMRLPMVLVEEVRQELIDVLAGYTSEELGIDISQYK
ncbi:MAG: 4-hydroxy-tetrahydrodipicolinate synthase [Alphaproteobacteria bacterium]|nr:4-hydroxy-tetrahydrodipicolinate synthase [Alphaproteobacteria bacterium]